MASRLIKGSFESISSPSSLCLCMPCIMMTSCPLRHEAKKSRKQHAPGLFSTFRSILMPAPQLNSFRVGTRASMHTPRRNHPIHHLPLEILASILVIASRYDPMIPLTVSHVCRTWRVVALQTPRLWRTINLDHREVMWAERIRRAKSCSLDMHIQPTRSHRAPRGTYTNTEYLQRIMYFAIPYLHRWRSLHITITNYVPLVWNAALSECCSTWPRIRASALEELSLVNPQNDDSKEFLLFGGYAPRLRRVTLDGIHLLWLPSLFHNLTHLDYTHHGFTAGTDAVRDVVYMLRVSCHLRELNITFRASGVPSRTSLHPKVSIRRKIILPLLVILRFNVCTADIPKELCHIASLLCTPTLRELSFVDVYFRRDSYPSTRSFFKRYVFPNTLQLVRRDIGWCVPVMNSCPCLNPHVRSACPTHDHHISGCPS